MIGLLAPVLNRALGPRYHTDMYEREPRADLERLLAVIIAVLLAWPLEACSRASPPTTSDAIWRGPAADREWFRARHGSCRSTDLRTAADLPSAVLELDPQQANASPLTFLPPADLQHLAALEAQRGALAGCFRDAQRGTVLARSAPGADAVAKALCTTLDRTATDCILSKLPTRADQPVSQIVKSELSASSDAAWRRYSHSLLATMHARTDLNACLRDGEAVWPETRDKNISVELVLSGTGVVTQALVVDDQTGIEDIACCLRASLEGMVFDAPPGCLATQIRYHTVQGP